MDSSTRSYQSQHKSPGVPLRSTGTRKVSLFRRVAWLLAWVGLAMRIRRERSRLAEMSDHQLKDIGVSREQANQESYRGIADIPPNRLKRPNAHRRL